MQSKYKRLSFFMLLLMLLLGTSLFSVQVAQAAKTVKIIMDGEIAQADVPPYIDANGRTMVPLRFVLETLGCQVDWNQEEKMVTVSQPGTTVELVIAQPLARVNGKEYELDTVAVLKESRTMVPVRFLAETFGVKVTWLEEEWTVALESPPPPPADSKTETRLAMVNGDHVNIRPGPGTDYDPPLTRVSKGTPLKVLADNGAWLQVELPNGSKGWIAGWYVDLAGTSTGNGGTGKTPSMPPDASRSALVMKPTVNLRSGPGLQYHIVSEATLGQRLAVLNEEDNWYAVQLEDGSKGWIAGWYVAICYDGKKQELMADGRQTASLISRWSARESQKVGELPSLLALKLKQLGSKVVLEIEADSPLDLPTFSRLDHPERLVFDLPACLGEDTPAPALTVKEGAVACFRLAQFNDGTVRVVADLRAPASYALEQSSDGKTLTLEILALEAGDRIIVIDPGHGALNEWGSDPGAIGPSGLKERVVNCNISMQLGHILLQEGYTVVYTNENNTGLSLEERAMAAGISGAELLVSIHANASTDPSLAGTMTFYHAPGVQTPKSMALAGFIQVELLKRLQREDRGIREANYAVLRNCPLPAALVEVAFISNPEEEMLLADPAFQRRAAEAIALGIKRYLAGS